MSLFSGFENFEELCFSSNPSPFLLSQEEREKLRNIHSEILELVAPENDKSLPSSLSSFQILRNCRSNFRGQNFVEVKVSGSVDVACPKVGSGSVNEMIRLAGERIIQSRSVKVDDLLELNQGPCDEKSEDVVVIIQHFLSSAEKIEQQMCK